MGHGGKLIWKKSVHQLPKIIPVTILMENGNQLKMRKKKKNQGEYLLTTAICITFVSGICFQELNLFSS